MPNSIKLHLVLTASPQKIYRAFTESQAMARWLAPDGFTCEVFSFDAKVGGKFKMAFTNFTNKKSHTFGGEFLELVPDEKIKYSDKFDDPNLPGVMVTTVILEKVSCGTDVTITQEGLPEMIPTEQCYLGWQQSLQYLAKLVEPNIEG